MVSPKALLDESTISAGASANSGSGTVQLKGFAAGTASGMTKLIVGHPFDTIKLRMQCSPPGTYSGAMDCLRRTIAHEGPRALYKGASPPAVGWAMSDALLLGSLHNYRLMFARIEARRRGEDIGDAAAEKLSLKGHFISGAMAGWTVCTVITPVEHIKARLQMQTIGPKLYTGPIDCATQVVKANGVIGLWHGFGATLLFRTWIGALFGSYEIMMRSFKAVPEESPWKVSNSTATFIAGGMSSNVFWCASFPFDAVKNRLMTDSPTHPRYPTWRSAAQQIWREGGMRAVYRGFLPCMLRAFPTNAAALSVYEFTMRMMDAEQLV